LVLVLLLPDLLHFLPVNSPRLGDFLAEQLTDAAYYTHEGFRILLFVDVLQLSEVDNFGLAVPDLHLSQKLEILVYVEVDSIALLLVLLTLPSILALVLVSHKTIAFFLFRNYI
jgi:hypothetical protein